MFITILLTLDLEETNKQFALKMYNEYYPIVKYIISNTIDDQHSLDDAIQECFISLLDKIPLLRELDLYKLNAYIATTAKRKSYNFNKKRKKQLLKEYSALNEDGEDILDNISCDSVSIENLIEWKDQHEKITDVMQELSDKYRDVLLLKYQYNMSDEEIANQIDLKPGSIRMYIKRAREKLIKLIEREKLYEFKK